MNIVPDIESFADRKLNECPIRLKNSNNLVLPKSNSGSPMNTPRERDKSNPRDRVTNKDVYVKDIDKDKNPIKYTSKKEAL